MRGEREVIQSLDRQIVTSDEASQQVSSEKKPDAAADVAQEKGRAAPGDGNPVFGFEQLEVYQAARAARKRINALVALLPAEERYRLRLQMKKAGLSLTNAIAEGDGRFTYKDRRHYCYEARGSLQEIVDDVNDCIDQRYAKVEHLNDLRRDLFRVLQLIDGWARWLGARHVKKSARVEASGAPSAATT